MQRSLSLFGPEIHLTFGGYQLFYDAHMAVAGRYVQWGKALHVGGVRVGTFGQEFEEDAQVA